MLHYDQTDISEDISFKKTGDFNECNICHYNYFFKINFSNHPCVCKSFITYCKNYNYYSQTIKTMILKNLKWFL